MKHIYTKSSLTLGTKFLSNTIKTLLILFSLLTFTGNAWGKVNRTWKASVGVGVGSGKGTAKVEIYTKILGIESSEKNTTTTGSLKSISSSQSVYLSSSLINRCAKYSVSGIATGYHFDGWYSSSACSGSAASTSNSWQANSYTTNNWDITYYAKFIPNTYTIKFNNNGGSGSMGDLAMTYDVAKNLTSNSFTRTGYTFSGWNTKEDGTGTSYSNGASVKNLTSTDGATITLYAKWTANTYTVKFNGNGNSGGSTANQSFTYGTAQNLRANGFTRAYTVTFDANGGTCATPSQTATYTFTGWAESATGAKKYNNSQNVNNLSATNGATVNLYAVWEGENITLPVATKEGKVLEGWFIGDEYIGAKNAIYAPTANVTLQAHWTDIAAPRYSWNGEESYLVGDEPLDLNELWVSANDEAAKTFTLVSFVPSGINNSGAVAPALTGSTLTLGQAGEITIKVTQPATEYFYAGEETRTIIVNKHANTILVKGQEAYHSEIEVDSYDNGFTFTATNTNYSASPITVEQLTGQSVATYYPDQKTVYSASFCGEATWQATQPESYFYESATAVFAVDVRLEAEEVCYILDDASEQKWGTIDESETYSFGVQGKVLTFKAKRTAILGVSSSSNFSAMYSADGSSWQKLSDIGDLPNAGQWYDRAYNLPANARYVKFQTSLGAVGYKHIKDVKVSRYTYLNLSEETLEFDKTADSKAIYPGEVSASKTFTIDWSMPNNGTEIQITTTNPDFRVSPAVISNTTCNNGSTVITVTYSSECAEVEEAKIRVGNQVFLKEINVTGTTIKRDQAITWTQEQNLLTTDNLVLAATASSNLDIEYSLVEGEDVASVNPATGEVTILKNGDVTFRASQAGDCVYNAAEPVDRVFHISLTPSALAMNDGSVVVSMPGSEYKLDMNTLIESQTGDGEITYAVISDNTATATIAANMFSAEALGDYTIRATKAQTNYYAETTADFVVTVIEGAIYTGDNLVWDDSDNWSNGVIPETTDRVIINADVELNVTATVAGLTINEGKTITIKDGGKLTVGDGNSLNRTTYGNIIVEAGGQLLLNEGNVEVNDFTLYSTFDEGSPKSGQVTGAEQLNAHGEAYFVLDLDPDGVATYGWYSFTVPFQVNAMSGVEYFKEGSWHQMVNEQNYAIMDYHEDLRAQGKYGWKKYRSILQPNTGYIITVDDELGINTVRFRKEQSAGFNTEMTQQLTATVVEGGTDADKGWNYIGNGTTSYINYGSTTIYAQVLDHAANVYNISMASFNTMVVGAAYVVQAANNTTLTMVSANETTTGLLRAPERETISSDAINISLRADQKTCDRLFITYGDEAAQTYTIGKDVKKMGTTSGASVARMWANAKGEQLAAVDMAFADNQVIVPLSLYAPATADFSITLADYPAEDVYLLHNGSIIADLTFSDHSLTLNAGTDNSYALLIVRRVSNVATGVDNMHEDANRGTDFVEKIMVNGQLYILRNGTLYDVQGRKATKL